MKIKGKYSESSVFHAILLSAAAVISVAVFFAVYFIMSKNAAPETAPADSSVTTEKTKESTPEEKKDENAYEADSEVAREMQDAVIKLIQDNYTVLRLYYIKGMNHKDEPYGNTPEDGYYSVESDDYKSLSQLEEIVDRTFISTFAEEIKTNSLGYGPVYKTRDNGDLGIIANFTPMEYSRSWANPTFKVQPISDTECDISITIHNKKPDSSEVKLNAHMTKEEGSWKLTSIVF